MEKKNAVTVEYQTALINLPTKIALVTVSLNALDGKEKENQRNKKNGITNMLKMMNLKEHVREQRKEYRKMYDQLEEECEIYKCSCKKHYRSKHIKTNKCPTRPLTSRVRVRVANKYEHVPGGLMLMFRGGRGYRSRFRCRAKAVGSGEG